MRSSQGLDLDNDVKLGSNILSYTIFILYKQAIKQILLLAAGCIYTD